MITQRQRLVVADGIGATAMVQAARFFWAYGVDVTLPFAVVHQDGSVYDLNGAVAAIMPFRKRITDAAAAMTVEWTITDPDAGEVEFTITRDMAPLLPPGAWQTGILFRDDDTGRQDVILLAAVADVGYSPGSFNDPVTVPESQEPLAQAKLGTAANYTALLLIDPAAKALRQYITLDDGALYYSNGTSWVKVGGVEVLTLTAEGATTAGTFGRPATAIDNGVTAYDFTGSPPANDPALRQYIILESKADGQPVRCIRARGVTATMLLDTGGPAVRGAPVYDSLLVAGKISAADSGFGAVGVFVANSSSGTTGRFTA